MIGLWIHLSPSATHMLQTRVQVQMDIYRMTFLHSLVSFTSFSPSLFCRARVGAWNGRSRSKISSWKEPLCTFSRPSFTETTANRITCDRGGGGVASAGPCWGPSLLRRTLLGWSETHSYRCRYLCAATCPSGIQRRQTGRMDKKA